MHVDSSGPLAMRGPQVDKAEGVDGKDGEEASAKGARSKQAVCNTYGHGVYDREFVRQMR